MEEINKIKNNLMEYIREWVQEYIITDYNIPEESVESNRGLCKVIWDIFLKEHGVEAKKFGERAAFRSWAQGLALGGLFCYYYNREALEDLNNITENKLSRHYSEEDAEKVLTNLIFLAVREGKNNDVLECAIEQLI